MHLNSLPDSILVRILASGVCASTQSALRHRLVCRHWRHVIEHCILEPKQSLKLFFTLEQVEHYVWHLRRHSLELDDELALRNPNSEAPETVCFRDDDFVVSDAFVEHFPPMFGRLFPRLESLVIFGRVLPLNDGAHFAANVHSLTLCDVKLGEAEWRSMLDPLSNTLTTLRLFDVTFDTSGQPPPDTDNNGGFSEDNSVTLQRLTHLSVCDLKHGQSASAVLARCLACPSLRQLRLRSVRLSWVEIERLFEAQSKLSVSLTWLSVDSIVITKSEDGGQTDSTQLFGRNQMLAFICKHLQQLQHLEITAEDYRLDQTELLHCLANLLHLNTLKLNGFCEETEAEKDSEGDYNTLATVNRLELHFPEFALFPPLPMFRNFVRAFPNLTGALCVVGDQHLVQAARQRCLELTRNRNQKSETVPIEFRETLSGLAPYMGRHRTRYETHLERDLQEQLVALQHYLAGLELTDDDVGDGDQTHNTHAQQQQQQMYLHHYDTSPENEHFRIIFIDYTNMFNY